MLGSTGSIGTQAIDVVAAQPGPVPGGGARRRRRQRRAARRAGRSSCGSTRSRWPGGDRADAVAALRQAAARAGRRGSAARGARGPGRRRPSSPRSGCRRRAQRHHRLDRAGAHARRAGRRPHARAGQQGVADRRRPAGQGRCAKPGPDRARSTPSTRRWPSACAAAAPTRCAGWCSPRAAGRSAAGRRAELRDVTPEQALAHPTWDMGPVVTINSATLVNKGLEVIEAHLLFDVPYDRIDVVVHPQSIVHSMVEFVDGSTIAQASPARHAAADRARPRLAGPGAGRRARLRLDRGARPGRSSRSTTRRSRRSAWPARVGAGGRHRARRCSTRPTRSASRRSSPAASPFLGIVDTVAAGASTSTARRARGNDPATLTVDDVLEAEAWARDAGPRTGCRGDWSDRGGARMTTLMYAARRARSSSSACSCRSRCTRSATWCRPSCSASGSPSTWSASARPSGRASGARPSTASRRSRSAATSG